MRNLRLHDFYTEKGPNIDAFTHIHTYIHIHTYLHKVKVKVALKTRKPRGGKSIALHSLDLGARRGGWSAPRPGRFIPGTDPVPSVQEAGWAPAPVWTCAKIPASTTIRSPHRPARSQSLYRLSYPDLSHIYIYT
jgi:hypothetical protein